MCVFVSVHVCSHDTVFVWTSSCPGVLGGRLQLFRQLYADCGESAWTQCREDYTQRHMWTQT